MIWTLSFVLIIGGFVAVRAHYRKVWTGIQRSAVAPMRERILTSGVVLSQLIPAALWLGGGLESAAIPLPAPVRGLGLLIGIAGLVLLSAVHAALGANFSPRLEIRPEHTLIRHGPYTRIRHPMYTSGALLILSYGLITANLVVFAVPAVMLVVLVALRLPDEEAMLEQNFGDAYRSWKAESGRFLPRITRPG